MPNRLDALFEGDTADHKYLMCALVAGDPHVEGTIDYLGTVAESGADIIELIVPFSDPAYHGPVIQRACRRAMTEEPTWGDVREIVETFRQDYDTPLVVSSYYNRILAFGLDRFGRLVGDTGVDAVMVADLPWDESESLRGVLEPHDVPLVPMVAPTTNERRIATMARESSTFFVWTGHSGGDVTLSRRDFERSMQRFRGVTDRPVIASMKISTGEEAASVVEYTSGVLVGSALIWLIEGRDATLAERLASFVGDIRGALAGEDE
jgi:tryptophan synthase alpha chain